MAEQLTEYRRKRDFSATPEPKAAGTARGRDEHRFVIHLHHARRRHFDLRLQVGNTLRSWAVPKGPSLDPAQKRLAVEVEDHPLAYGNFEGTIPAGHYGAGQVWIWDRGHWTPDGDPQKALQAGRLHFTLEGERLQGSWSLVRTRLAGKQPQWLLIKSHDDAVRAGDVADDTPLSEWHGDGTAPAQPQARAPAEKGTLQARRRRVARRGSPLPEEVGLQLARLAERAPAGDDWLHEVKFDGYRVLLWRDGDTVRVTSRGGQDWTGKLTGAVEALRALPCERCVLDGEMVALDDKGRSSFHVLQAAFGEGRQQILSMMLFDVLHLDGEDLRERPQLARKQALAELLRGARPPLHYTDHMIGHGAEAAAHACAEGLEGIICKKVDAPYAAGRGGGWLKVKCIQSDEYAVIGYTTGQGARATLGSLLLARPGEAGKWRYMGRAGTGLDDAMIRELLQRMRRARGRPALERLPTRAQLRGATPLWLTPELVVEVEFRGLTGDGILRQASIKGLREDRSAASLQPGARDQAQVSGTRAGKGGSRAGKGGSRESVEKPAPAAPPEVRLTHPERELFKDPVITKRELADFYSSIADWIMPGLSGRPLMLLRCPDGGAGACFFQKHLSRGFPETVREVRDAEDGQRWIYVDSLEGLLGLVQMNAVEYHVWGAKAADLDHADRLVFDLDPAEDVEWKDVTRAALEMRDRLQQLGMTSFVRTTGGKGLHVVVPLDPAPPWPQARNFCRALAEAFAQQDPQRYIAVATKARRGGRIFIDYLRNGRGATAVASYSLRNRPGAPIATPLDWSELARLRTPQQFGYASIRRRLARLGRDPWEGMVSLRQSLPRL